MKFYVNGNKASSISEYVINHGDGILISFGNETNEEVQEQFGYLDSLKIYDVPKNDENEAQPNDNLSI